MLMSVLNKKFNDDYTDLLILGIIINVAGLSTSSSNTTVTFKVYIVASYFIVTLLPSINY